MMTAPMVDYKIHWLTMMSVPESRAVVGRHDGINGRDNTKRKEEPVQPPKDEPTSDDNGGEASAAPSEEDPS